MSQKRTATAKSHPVKNLSGGGFAFEDRVGAWVAAAMLAGAAPLDPELGPPTRVDFQVDADGWRLDDLLVSFAHARWCASIKSYPQIDADKATTDFVTRAWEEILGTSGSSFDPAADLLGMVTAPIDTQSLGDVHELIKLARDQEPEHLASRIRKPGYVGTRRRTLWDSFAMPESLGPAEGLGVTTSPGEVLRRLRVIEADFDHSPSRLEEQALRWCGAALADPNEAPALWDHLLAIVSQVRTAGGLLTRPILGAKLRRRFELRDHPAYERDWSVLREITVRNTDQVADRLGGRLHIDRSGDIATITEHAAQPTSLLALVGPSGCGKTALAKAWAATIGGGEVVWLQPDDVATVAQLGGPLRHSLVDVLRSACNGGWIIVDGLDRSFSNMAYQAVAQLVTALVSDDTLSFGMLVTSQQQEWARVTDRLAEHNAVVVWDALPVGSFSDADLKQTADTFPALSSVMQRGRLAGVLSNPKVLDIVVRNLTAADAVVRESMIHDEASFAGWFYDRLVRGSGGGRASRSVLVMRLAEIQGDRLQAETSLRDLDGATLDHVDDLERDGVCQQRDGRLRFSHDLYGDWVRYQLLRNQRNDLPDYLRGRLSSPLWHRAIRLHSLAVLASHQVEEWRTEMQRLGGETLGLLHDLFLEAPLFAAEPGPALEKVWPVLIDDNGRLLCRLIGRFLHIATVPNPALLATIRDVQPDLETHMATTHRLPYWPLWLPLLQALSAHADDALEVAGDEVARLVDLWLRTVPETWPLRPEAAALAIARGRRVLEDRRTRRYGAEARESRAWHAVLAAVRERHDDVVEITSSLTNLGGSDDEEVDDELPAHGQLGVDQAFSDACLNTDALHPVIATDPKLAGDILFAILAPRPRRRSQFGGDLPWDELGMDRFPRWLIPLYTRGPFLAFLRTAPVEACAFTRRLVDAATKRWVEVRSGSGASVSGIEVPLGDSHTLTVRGDQQVLQWYRGDSRVPSTLASALMSLEKWLYNEFDAGHDIGPVARDLLENATSVAILGLLTAFGCRHPELLQGPLRPLLGVPELYLWDRWYKLSDQSHLLIGLVGETAQVRQLAHEWYSLEHRGTRLEEVAQRHMLTDPGVAAFLAEARALWRERLDDQGEPTTLRILISTLDPANWSEKTHSQGFSYWEYEQPDELRAESQRAVQEANQQVFWLMMPMRCRQILDGERSLRDEDLDELWDTFQSQALIPPGDGGSDDSVISREDTECGLAAVLLIRHPEWLRRHPEREQWCVDRMVEAVSATRERRWYDSPESGIAWSWDAFSADALPIRWAEQPNEPRLREAIVRLALNMHYKTIVRLFAAAGQRRDTLGDDFRRLQHLAVHIACFHVAMQVARGDDGAREQASAVISAHIDRFVNATLEPTVPAWADLAVPPDDPTWRGWLKLDDAYLQAAYAWMPPLADARDAQERAEWIEYWHQSVDALVRRLRLNIDKRDGEVHGTPYQAEYALLRALPARIIQMRLDEARAAWEPILALSGVAHYWVERFLDSWFMVGLQTVPAYDEFVQEWQAMLDYTEAAEAWSGAGRSHHVAELRRHLMGLGEFILDLWTEGQAQVIARMAPYYDRWAHQSLDGSRNATQLARFLRMPGSTPLVADGLIWLATAEGSASSAYPDNHYEDSVGTLLDHLARRRPDIPRSAGAVGDAYRTLLKRLADRQVPIALELASRLSSLTGPAGDS